MFSDTLRLGKILLSLAVLAALGWYGMENYPKQCFNLTDALRLPEHCNNRIVRVGQSTISALAPGGFDISLPNGASLFVPYQGKDNLRVGGHADILGRFSKDTGFEPLAVHVYFDRSIKLYVSFAAAIIVALYVLYSFVGPRS